MDNLDYSVDEKLIANAVLDARKVQEFLWGDISLQNFPFEQNHNKWVEVFAKRVFEITNINYTHPSHKVELRKLLLQQAALSICALKALIYVSNDDDIQTDKIRL